MGGGMARRHVELVRRLGPDPVLVSTVAADPGEESAAAAFDAGESYPIARQPFPFRGAKTILHQAQWARWLVPHTRRRPEAPLAVIHCGNIRPAGYPTWWAHRATGAPYVVYVYGGDLLRERRKMAAGASQRALKRWTARRILGDAAGVIAISDWTADLAREVMATAGVREPPPVLVNPLGTDPDFFRPGRDARTLRAKLALGDAPLMLTVARLVPHKGIDVACRALAALAPHHPALRYLVAGVGDDAARLAALVRTLGVEDRVRFAGALSDAEIADAYATAAVYVGLSRVDAEINAEGFGIAFIEAAASATPSVAGDSGGVRSAVRDGETGLVVNPTDVGAVAQAIGMLLDDPGRRRTMGEAARKAAEGYYNWTRVAEDVRAFVHRIASAPESPPGRVLARVAATAR